MKAIQKPKPALSLTVKGRKIRYTDSDRPPSREVIVTAANSSARTIKIEEWRLVAPRDKLLLGMVIAGDFIEAGRSKTFTVDATKVVTALRRLELHKPTNIRGVVIDAVGNRYRSPKYLFRIDEPEPAEG
jgi:hypothetical protein